MNRGSATLLAALFFGVLVIATSAKAGIDRQQHHDRVVGHGQIKFDGLGPEQWARRAGIWHRAYLRTRRELMHSPSVREAIGLSCATYGFCSSLWRKAECESHLYPLAHNPSGASGLFQFLPSTFNSTPYRGLSIWSPYANALAAGWMHQHGRGGEWVCQ
jgi:hypothetical protein